MKKNCPNSLCPNFNSNLFVVKNGKKKRACDSKMIQRYQCKTCKKYFSNSTGKLEFNQKKRRKNPLVYELLASGISMRRAAKITKLSRGTITRRLCYFGKKSRVEQKRRLDLLKKDKVEHLQIDDLVTKENSKLKPLSVSIAVDAKRRYILGAEVSELRAFGHLASVGHVKYPGRKNKHKEGLFNLFEKIKDSVIDDVRVKSDEHKFYPEFVNRYFPAAKHKQFRSEKGCIAGQGELKKVKFDPLFAINHTCAMFRANINRLFRRTWCTTKDADRLQDHLDLFINYFNSKLIKNAFSISTR